MQDFYLFANWFVALALLGLAGAALVKSHRSTLNRVFALFAITVGIWIVASYISNDVTNSPHASVVGNDLVFLFSYAASYLLLWFAVALAQDASAARWLKRFAVPILAVGATTCTPLVVAGAHRQGHVYAVEFGPLVFLYFIGVVLQLGLAMHVLHRNMKRTTDGQRAHLSILYHCMVVALPIILLTEFVLPAITGWFGLTNIGIIFMAIPVVGLYYSVVRLKLFNLRLVVVRALAYVLSLAVIGVAYGLSSYYLTTLLIKTSNRVVETVMNVILIMAAVAMYQPTIRAFRRLTNRLFYRDAYNTQELFDQLNRLLVSTLDLNKLLARISTLIVTDVKSQFCLFDLKKTPHSARRLIGAERTSVKLDDISDLCAKLPKTSQRPIVVEDLPQAHLKLKRILEADGIAVLIRLAPSARDVDTELGYMLLGGKKSGNPYSSQDLRVLDSLAKELSLAIQNTLHYEEIQSFNETLRERINQATKELRRTNDKLKTLDATKDEFISMASHQLRTPLTSVKGYLSMVLEGDVGPINDQQRQMLTQSYNSSQRMVYLISDLLNLSRLNTGKFVIETTSVDLGEVVQVEVEQLAETAKSRNLTLTYQRPTHFPRLMLDETKIHQVVMNLIDNAIYYTPSGGTVTVSLKETATAVEYTVTDTGIGVPKSVQHKLFSKFYRAGNAQAARPDGTGLGLFMAKKVVVAQGGAMIFESTEGKGSTFGFRFSKAEHLAPSAPTGVDKPKLAAAGKR